ncbi:MAG: type IV pilus modification PilV family protein [Chthoniobacterales bacterium]
MKLRSIQAFSLLEILVALTLFAVVVMAVLDLWPTALRLTREAEQHRSAILLAQRIAETLQVTSPNSIIAVAPDWKSNPSHCITLGLNNSSEHYVAYNGAGEPYRELSTTEYQTALREKNMVSVAKISTTNNPFPKLANISVIVSTPAALPEKQRYRVEFVFLIQQR